MQNQTLEIVLSYVVPYGIFQFGVPAVLTWIGFGPMGIVAKSVAAWIQRKYGVSKLFSFFQAVGARGGIGSVKSLTLLSGSTYHLPKLLGDWQKDPFTSQPNVEDHQQQVSTDMLLFIFVAMFSILFWSYYQRYRQNTRVKDRRKPIKIIENLPRDSNGYFSCPQCQKQFKPQGITNHIKSCAKNWCASRME